MKGQASVSLLSEQTPSTPTEYVVTMPFEAYTDSPDHAEMKNPNVRMNPVRGPQHVGPRTSTSTSLWRQAWALSCFPSSKHSNDSSSSRADDEEDIPLLEESSPRKKRHGRSRIPRYLVRSLLAFFVMLGLVQFFTLTCGIILSFFPDEYDRAASRWARTTNEDITSISQWPTDLSRDIFPVACHSHNDYWRRVPLYSALQAGCTSVEADVWAFEDTLYVGHTTASLTAHRTLKSMYIEPLLRILEQQNPTTAFQRFISNPLHGVFDTDPDQTLVLLIDFKTDGESTWIAVMKELEPLRARGFLTYFDGHDVIPGPVTVVGTGNTPFDLVVSNSTYRDIFFDAPLNKLFGSGGGDSAEEGVLSFLNLESESEKESDFPDIQMESKYNVTNSYYASVSLNDALGFSGGLHFSKRQMELLRGQVNVAHRLGLKARYWGLPSWPRSLRSYVWRVLVQEGVDVLNVDDLVGATKGKWRVGIFDWRWW